MNNMNNTNREQGVALIFALGLLTLMSALGVAFVANSLTAQKTAVNISARNQSQILLDSAINRILATLSAVVQQDGSVNDYSVIYSTNDGQKRSASPTLSRKDQLEHTTDSKLNVFVPGQPKYDGNKSHATWVYIKDNTGKITGRMAYQVLPTGTSSISLDRVLKGIYNLARKGLPSPGVPTPAENSAWQQRIGQDIGELNIGQSAAFYKQWKWDAAAAAGSGYDKLPADTSVDIVSTFDNFFNLDMCKELIKQPQTNPVNASIEAANDEREVWLRRWFSQNQNSSPEAFFRAGQETTKMDEATMYHRFNVGEFASDTKVKDPWYSRFSGLDIKSKDDAPTNSDAAKGIDSSLRSSDKVVTELLKDSQIFYPEDEATPPGVGLPYLRHICDSPGSFNSLEDRRKQIAANLNDYCDEDLDPDNNTAPKRDLPTSDVSAFNWDQNWWTAPDKPKYTGNEKTPYINEFVLGFQMAVPQVVSGGNIEIKLTPEILTEIIDIYGVTGNSSAKNYSMKVWLNKMLTLKITNANGQVTYSDNTTESFSGISCENTPLASGTEIPSEAVSIDVAGTAFSNGYAIARKELDNSLMTKVFSLKEKIEAQLQDKGSKTITKVTYDSLDLQISNIELVIKAAVLFDKTNTPYGIDFVKGPADKIVSAAPKEIKLKFENSSWEPVLTTGKVKSNAWRYFYLAGLEVRDPRQNLNFNKATTKDMDFITAASDWKAVPSIEYNFEKDSGSSDKKFKVGTIEIDYAAATPTFAGLVNSCSNPSQPFFDSSDDKYQSSGSVAVWAENYDRETVTDPAYLGPNANQRMSTAHIRNAPMQSLWELGAIHRGAAWQTINIKGMLFTDGGSDRRLGLHDLKFPQNLTTPGISYKNGDGAILDQTKLTNKAYTSGKLDVNMLLETPPASPGYNVNWNQDIVRALFCNIIRGHQISDLYVNAAGKILVPSTGAGLTKIGWNALSTSQINALMTTLPTGHSANNVNKNRYLSRADFLEGASVGGNAFLANGFGIIPFATWETLPDAQQEELVGKTINLLTAGATAPTSIHAVVVVQTIKSAPDGATIVRPTYDGQNNIHYPSQAATSGFDVKQETLGGEQINVYYDEITSELRALVALKFVLDPTTGTRRFMLDNIQYY